jgi:predicted RNase H-like nuclease (RuvC/YqgF family)
LPADALAATNMSVTIESDLKEVLDKIDRKLDNLQKDVTDLRTELKQDIADLKIESVAIKGEIKVLDTKIDGLSTRLQNQEFLSRYILGSLLLIVLGGTAKMFGLFPASS